MEMQEADFDRLLFFEHARRRAESQYIKNPLDADNLTQWGNALLELSQFQQQSESFKMVQEAISKLEEALQVQPNKHDALWSLGNVYTSQALLNPDLDVAKSNFEKATSFFQRALDQDPGNELYLKSLEMAAKAPELHAEIHSQATTKRTLSGGPSASRAKGSNKKESSDLKYDILGWVILAVGIVTWLGMAKSHVPPTPPR